MKNEFTPSDFDSFVANSDCMTRYQECADRCLLFNFRGAIAPLIQEIISDMQTDEDTDEDHRCESCPLTKRENRLAQLLIIDSLL